MNKKHPHNLDRIFLKDPSFKNFWRYTKIVKCNIAQNFNSQPNIVRDKKRVININDTCMLIQEWSFQKWNKPWEWLFVSWIQRWYAKKDNDELEIVTTETGTFKDGELHWDNCSKVIHTATGKILKLKWKFENWKLIEGIESWTDFFTSPWHYAVSWGNKKWIPNKNNEI